MNESIEQTPSGREILKNLEVENKYVFHGSEDPHLESLEPRQAFTMIDGKKVEDDKPAVHASQFCDIAIFMGLINEKNCPEGFRNTFSYEGGKGLTFSASQQALDQLGENAKGYVYVFAKEDFISRGRAQLVSYREVKPLRVVEVGNADLPENIEIKGENE
jgi:hypothetical protein